MTASRRISDGRDYDLGNVTLYWSMLPITPSTKRKVLGARGGRAVEAYHRLRRPGVVAARGPGARQQVGRPSQRSGRDIHCDRTR